MKMVYFIIPNLIIIIPIIYLFKYKGDKFLGLNLNKKWFYGLLLVEFLWLVFLWFNYQSIIDASTANDFLWYNQFNYYRGVLPVAVLMNIKDFSINASSALILLPVYIIAIVVDYILLRLLSYFKK